MTELTINGDLTDIDGRAGVARIGDITISGLGLDQLKALGPHVLESVRITITPRGNFDVAQIIRLEEIQQVRRDMAQPTGCRTDVDEALKAVLFGAIDVLIESDNGFWRKGGGYCFQEHAGRFTGEDAYGRTNHCGPEKAVRYHILRKA